MSNHADKLYLFMVGVSDTQLHAKMHYLVQWFLTFLPTRTP